MKEKRRLKDYLHPPFFPLPESEKERKRKDEEKRTRGIKERPEALILSLNEGLEERREKLIFFLKREDKKKSRRKNLLL